MAQPKVCIVILHLRDTAGLTACLASLRNLAYPDFEIILVHNGPPDAALDALAAAFPGGRAKVLHTGGNFGFAKGNNEGIRQALQSGAAYVLLLNDDTVVNPDFLGLLVAEGEKDASAGMLGPEVLYLSDPGRIAFSGAKLNLAEGAFSFPRAEEPRSAAAPAAPLESDYINGCALLVKRAVIEKIGPLDERFFLYWEDSEWGQRALKAGYRCLVVPAATILHSVSASTGGNDSPLKAYHKVRGGLLFAELHAPGAKKKILAGLVRDIAWLLLKSGRADRFEKAWACLAGAADYFTGPVKTPPAEPPPVLKTSALLLLVFAGAAFFLYYGLYKMLTVNFGFQGQDFLHGYYAANNFFNGRSIYEMPPLVTPYPYFPPATLFFMPLSWLPENIARGLWLFLGLGLSALSFLALYRFGRGSGKLRSAAAASAVLLLSTPLYQMLLTGNLNILIFTGLTLAYAALLSGRSAWVPVAIALFASVKIFPAVMMGFFARRGPLRAWLVFALTLCGLAAVSLTVFGAGDTAFYFSQLTGLSKFAGPMHSMSLTFILRLIWPGAQNLAFFLTNLLLLSALISGWWIVSSKQGGRTAGAGAALTDLFILTSVMILAMPFSWPFYCAFYAVPFYFVLLSLLEGRRDFKLPGLFLAALCFFNFWEILYYHFPLSTLGLTARVVDLNREMHPAMFAAVFSLHFAANLALYGWALLNYRALADNIDRVRAGETGGERKDI